MFQVDEMRDDPRALPVRLSNVQQPALEPLEPPAEAEEDRDEGKF